MSPRVSPVLVQRLAFAKYLLATGAEQTKQPEPLAAAGLLSLHDAVEFASHVASEHLGATLPARATFLDYWDALDKVLAPKALPERTAMERLNKARVALKHHGTMPSRLDLDSFEETAQRFFAAMFPLVFRVGLHKVSMVEFVAAPKARKHLKLAQDHLQKGALEDGFTEAASAFSELLDAFEAETEGAIDLGAIHRGSVYDDTAQAIQELAESVRLLAMGINLRHLARFRRLTPHVIRMMGKRLSLDWNRTVSNEAKDLEFCIQFVLECALRIQRGPHDV